MTNISSTENADQQHALEIVRAIYLQLERRKAKGEPCKPLQEDWENAIAAVAERHQLDSVEKISRVIALLPWAVDQLDELTDRIFSALAR